MYNFAIIFIFLFVGVALQQVKNIPTSTHKTLNKIVINICLPALALYYIPKIVWKQELLYPIAVAWIGFVGSYLFFSFFGNRFGWSKKLTGCLIITAGLGNTSFLGFPIIKALYGEEGLKTAILVDQPGSFIVLSTLGILVAGIFAKGSTDRFQIIKNILFFPPFITFTIACLMNVMNLAFPELIQNGLQKIGMLITPLAMLSVGLQLRLEKRSKHWKFLGLGLFFKLILTPLFIYILYVFVFDQRSMITQVAIMEAAMAPMITGSILASSYGLKPRLSSMMIGFGIPLSFLTLLFWYFVVKTL